MKWIVFVMLSVIVGACGGEDGSGDPPYMMTQEEADAACAAQAQQPGVGIEFTNGIMKSGNWPGLCSVAGTVDSNPSGACNSQSVAAVPHNEGHALLCSVTTICPIGYTSITYDMCSPFNGLRHVCLGMSFVFTYVATDESVHTCETETSTCRFYLRDSDGFPRATSAASSDDEGYEGCR